MRVLITSFVFPPSVGGIERASLDLARALARQGLDVVVATRTAEHWPGEDAEPFRTVRRPSAAALLQLVRGVDVVVVNNVSVRLQWPLLLVPRPHVIVLHAALESGTLRLRVVRGLKTLLLRRAGAVVAVSGALGRLTPVPSRVIPNMYDPTIFHESGTVPRAPRSVAFLGRLVHQKGADVLVDAVALLRRRGVEVDLTVIGDGLERQALEEQVRSRGIEDHARFTGNLRGRALNDMLQATAVLAVPSRGHEPFALTVLEGLAAGCAVVVTDTGGPPEALGPVGLVVPPDDADRLADAIERLLTDDVLRAGFDRERAAHLEAHSPAVIGREYERLLRDVAARGRRAGARS